MIKKKHDLEKVKRRHGDTVRDYVIYDSRDRFGFEDDYRYYKDWCRSRKKKPKKKDTNHFRRFLKDFEASSRKIFFSNLGWSSITGVALLTGDTSDWDGKSNIPYLGYRSENLHLKYTGSDGINIYGYETTGIQRAIMSIACHKDTEDFMLELKNGELLMHAFRKDGREVTIEVHVLNEAGEKAYVTNHVKMTEYLCRRRHFLCIYASNIDF